MPTAQTVIKDIRLEATKNLLFKLNTKVVDVEFEIDRINHTLKNYPEIEKETEQGKKEIEELNVDLATATRDLKKYTQDLSLLEDLFVKYSKASNAGTTTKRKL